MIEEVKKILLDNTQISYAEYGNSGQIPHYDLDVDTAAQQICQLFLEWLQKHGNQHQIELFMKEYDEGNN